MFMPLTRFLSLWCLLVCLLLAFSGPLMATPLTPLAMFGGKPDQQKQEKNPKQLRQSLDEVISTLENAGKRKKLLKQLKALRSSLKHAGKQGGESTLIKGGGLLDALALSFGSGRKSLATGKQAWAHWRALTSGAEGDFQQLITSEKASDLWRNLVWSGLGLVVWLGLVLLLIWLVRLMFKWFDWPVELPGRHKPLQLLIWLFRQILPWGVVFVGMLLVLPNLNLSALMTVVVLVAAWVSLCGRVFSSLVEAVISLFAQGHRQTAVDILRRKAIVPLFVIGMLVAFSDMMLGKEMIRMLGEHLSEWLSVVSGAIAGLLCIWLILRIRRPVSHLIANRRYSVRHKHGARRRLVLLLARLWYVLALLLVGVPLIVLVVTGGEGNEAIPKAIACVVMLVGALVAASLCRRQAERIYRRNTKGEYRARLIRFGYTLARFVIWLLFVELSLRVWGWSLGDIGEHSPLLALLANALVGICVTILVAWLAWILADTALERAMLKTRGGGQRANVRLQTISPLVRNIIFFTILVIAILMGLASFGVNITPLLAGAGIIGLAIGFGAQALVQDLITGLFILVEDALAVGDFIQIRGYMGTVEGLNLRTVRLRDLDGVLHILTFGHIDSIHNMSRRFGITLLKIRLPRDLPVDDAIEMMQETAAELRKEPFVGPLVWSDIEMQDVHSFEEGCAVLRMRMRTAPEYQWNVGRAFNLLLKRRMEARDVHPGAARLSISMEAQGGRQYDVGGDGEEASAPTG